MIINHFVESSLIEWTFIMVCVSIRYDMVNLYYSFTSENVSVLVQNIYEPECIDCK